MPENLLGTKSVNSTNEHSPYIKAMTGLLYLRKEVLAKLEEPGVENIPCLTRPNIDGYRWLSNLADGADEWYQKYFQGRDPSDLMPAQAREDLFNWRYQRGGNVYAYNREVFQEELLRRTLMLAVGDVTNHLRMRVASLHGVTQEMKETAAYFLAQKIRRFGRELHYVGMRSWELDEALTTKECYAIYEAGLVAGAPFPPRYNKAQWKDGWGSQEAWDKGVFEVAAGILEAYPVAHLQNLLSQSLTARIYQKNNEILEELRHNSASH